MTPHLSRSGRLKIVVTSVFVGLLVLVGTALGAFFAIGPERVWAALFGDPDLGPIRFETLDRAGRRNDALACPANLCRAQADLVPPIYAVSARDLRAAFGRIAASEPRMTLADADDLVPSERWVQRSERMRFPDTFEARFIDLPGGRSTLAVYSRSQIGIRDYGVNRARIDRLLEKLGREVPAAP